MSDERSARGFRVSTGAPDAIDLELAELGAVADPAARERIAAAAAGPLRDVAADLTAHRARFVARPLPRPARSSAWWWGPVALAAAAAALVVGVSLRPEPGVRAMGGLPVDVSVRHAEGAAGAPDGTWAAGDEVFLRLVSPIDGVVEVATLEADGDVTVLDAGTAVAAGATWRLAGAARLDDHADREWLIVSVRASARDVDAIRADLRGMLPAPAADARRSVTELTRTR